MKVLYALLITAISLCLATSSVRAGAGKDSRTSSHSGADTRLVIKRAPNFGNNCVISVYINGRLSATLTYGRSYEGVLPPGRHLITMKQTPHLNDAYPYSQQWIRLAPGQTSSYTAFWRDAGTRIVLDKWESSKKS